MPVSSIAARVVDQAKGGPVRHVPRENRVLLHQADHLRRIGNQALPEFPQEAKVPGEAHKAADTGILERPVPKQSPVKHFAEPVIYRLRDRVKRLPPLIDRCILVPGQP